jgi:hypothetical protein
MVGITKYMSKLTLDVSCLNSAIQRHRLANWIKKEDSTICCLEEHTSQAETSIVIE